MTSGHTVSRQLHSSSRIGLLIATAGCACSSSPATSVRAEAGTTTETSSPKDSSQAERDGPTEDLVGSASDSRSALPGVHLGQDGNFLVDGAPFFPVGAYVVSWSLSTAAILDDLQQIKEAGFNTAHLGLSADELVILDRAQQLGLKLIVEGANTAQITRLASHPALLAWNIQDEPDINGVPPSEVQAKYDSRKSLDANHPTLIVVTDDTQYRQYASIPDVFGIDPYINHYSGTPISYVGDCTASALGLRSSLLVVAHAFQEGGRFPLPSVAQERSIVYQAIVNGARALLFFAFDAPPADHWFMPDSGEFFAGVQTLLSELSMVGPLLAAATTRESLAVPVSGVRAAHIVAAAKHYVLVVSSLAEAATGVQLALGWNASGATELFEGRTLPVSGQSIVDDVDAYGSHVYRIE